MSVKDNIAKNIAGLRKQKGLTQSELADILCYSNKSISKWERGDSLPDADMLYTIAKTFNVDVNYLFEEHDYNEEDREQKAILERKQKIAKVIVVVIFSLVLIASVFIFVFAILRQYITIAPPIHAAIGFFVICSVTFLTLIVLFVLNYVKYTRILFSLFIWTGAFAIYFMLYESRPLIVLGIALIIQLATVYFPRIDSLVIKHQNRRNEFEKKRIERKDKRKKK